MKYQGNILEQYICEWLTENNTLTIHGLGTFTTSYQNASIQSSAHKINPPKKIIQFDKQLIEDDGELLSFLVQNKAMELDEAQQLIKEYVRFVHQDLQDQKKYTIPNLGTLFLQADNSLGFQPSEDNNLFEDVYGMGAVFYPPLQNPSIAQNAPMNEEDNNDKQEDFEEKGENLGIFGAGKETQNDHKKDEEYENEDDFEEDEIEEEREVNTKPYLWVAIILLVIFSSLALFLMFGKNIFSDKKPLTIEEKRKATAEPKDSNEETDDNKKKNEEKEKEKNQDKKEENTKANNTNPAQVVLPNIPAGTLEQGFAENTTPPQNLNQVLVTQKQNKFYPIIASFDTAPNAYSYYNNLEKKGFKGIKIIKTNDANPKYRVSLGEYTTKNEARTQNIAISNKYNIKSWVWAN